MLRKYRRELARTRMKREGFRRINDHGKNRKNGSYFSNHWREYLNCYKQVEA